MKKILIGISVLASVAVAAVFLLVGNVDKIVKGAIENRGSNPK